MAVSAGIQQPATPKSSGISFVQNFNQWEEPVEFRGLFDGNHLVFLEKTGFTYLLAHPDDAEVAHSASHHHDGEGHSDPKIRMHAYKVHFEGANPVQPVGLDKKSFYHNYFQGNDPAKWAGHVPAFGKVHYPNVYSGIDLNVHSQNGHFKYDFIVNAGSSPATIALRYDGMDGLQLDNGNLIVQTSVGHVTEFKPVAWQEGPNGNIPVACEYHLSGKLLQFGFPNGFDPSLKLVIDPTVVASTIAGTANITTYGTFGHSATFDSEGNMYTGGRCFGAGYPATTGAFDLDFNGGTNDIVVSKYNPTGTNMFFATYIGGEMDDFPHSLVADFNQQLYIYGTSNSEDYPVTPGAYQDQLGGSTDIVVTVLSTDGASLVGSSFFGGSQDDGFNLSVINANYGDQFRGEIILDNQNNVFVVSSTASSNFPTTAGAYDQTFDTTTGGFDNPAQDVVVFKASSDVSSLYWGTYLGGDQSDIGNTIRLDDNGDVYITGTAGADNFPTTPGTVMPAWPGGIENAFVAKLSGDGSSLLRSTFWGTPDGDSHGYFLDIDEDDNVHIYGQTTGTIDVTPGTYSSGNGSTTFLAAFDKNLQSVVYATVIGNDSQFDGFDMVPVAFMVDKCNHIYLSGYYAANNLPTTAGAFNTDGDNFYLAVLDPNAVALSFATYFGDAGHVDGGTSRFDKSGVVYQGVCSCMWSGELNTNPDAWEPVQVSGCDVGVFKIDFEKETVTAAGTAIPAASGCAPFEVDFMYTGQDATSFFWDFGDNNTSSTLENPTHTYQNAGSYEVMLIATNANACNAKDTVFLQIEVLNGESTLTQIPFCNQSQVILNAATPNATYTWQNGSTSASQTATAAGIYWVDIQIQGCSRRDSFELLVPTDMMLDLGPDQSLCDVPSISFNAFDPNAVSYEWSDGSTGLDFTASASGTYWVAIQDAIGCTLIDSITILLSQTPVIDLGEDATYCEPVPLVFDVTAPDATYLWQNGTQNASFSTAATGLYWVEVNVNGCKARDSINILVLPPIALNEAVNGITCAGDCDGAISLTTSGGGGGPYNFTWSNGEGSEDLASLCPGQYALTVTDSEGCSRTPVFDIPALNPLAFETIDKDPACYQDGSGSIQVELASGGTPPYVFSIGDSLFAIANVFSGLNGGLYQVLMADANGCELQQGITITDPPPFDVYAGEDQTVDLGQFVTLQGQIIPLGTQDFSWSPSDNLPCADCLEPNFQPLRTTLYTLTAVEPNSGCVHTDEVLVTVRLIRDVYIPNAFSPTADGINDQFTIFAGPAVEAIEELKIFDRWGNLVFENYNFAPNDLRHGWDGRFRDREMQPAVFAYYTKVKFIDGEIVLFEGDVVIVR